MVKTAVILAAGLGSRLGEVTKQQPKGMLRIGSESLVERSIRMLRTAGIESIVIGTGHCADVYHALAKNDAAITCIANPEYASTGSMHTLYTMRDSLTSDFLLLESDLLFEPDALTQLLQASEPNLVLISDATHSGDEVYVQGDADNNLQNVSKDSTQLASVGGELVGISKISAQQYQHMCQDYAGKNNTQLDYEQQMAALHADHPFALRLVKGLLWCEIDDANHYGRAIGQVFPAIRAKEVLAGQLTRNVLLNPGPATTTSSVKMAQIVPDICPREREFGELMQRLATGLTGLVASPDTYNCVLFAASGTGAVEAVISSAIADGQRLLIVNNGAYGKRMCNMAKTYGIEYFEYTSAADQPIDMQALEQAIVDQRITHLAVVHNETTTGLLNDLDAIGACSHKHNLVLIVDAMSSYAAIPIDAEKQHIDYLCASANKNIQGMAGVSFVIANSELLDSLASVPSKSHYLDLYAQYQSQEKAGQMRFTPPVQTMYALEQALEEVKLETVAGRNARYTACWDSLIAGLQKLGLQTLVDAAYHSKIITAVHMPKGVDFDHMHDYLYARGYTIYPGKLENMECFRIANIGAIDSKDIAAFLHLLEQYLQQD